MSNDRVSGERRASIEPAGVGTYHLLHMLLIETIGSIDSGFLENFLTA